VDDAQTILAGLSKPAACPYVEVFLCLVGNYASGRLFIRLP
jgi:hypothetical protein